MFGDFPLGFSPWKIKCRTAPPPNPQQTNIAWRGSIQGRIQQFVQGWAQPLLGLNKTLEIIDFTDPEEAEPP